MNELTLAKILIKIEDCLESSQSSYQENFFEAAVNRAYYAMFHSVQALLFVSGYHTKTHSGGHSKFRELFIKTGILDAELSTILQRSFEKRQFSDYDYDEVMQEDALESINDARFFLNATILYLKQNNFLK
jgi:uncharacterized protein (UPF0332 family)